jgi:hypothetical protein
MNTTTYNISNTLKKETIPKTFIKRNNFAPLSIRYDRAKGYDLNNMYGMVGQLQHAGRDNTKTLLEENELGQPIHSKTKHTLLGLKTIRTNKSFTKTIKKENRLTALKPKPASDILKNYSYDIEGYDYDKKQELSRIAGLIANNRLELNKPVIARTKKNTIGIFQIDKSAEDKNKVNITKLYDLRNKTTNIKKREWLKNTTNEQLNSNNLNKTYYKMAKNLLDRNAKAFHISIINSQ